MWTPQILYDFVIRRSSSFASIFPFFHFLLSLPYYTYQWTIFQQKVCHMCFNQQFLDFLLAAKSNVLFFEHAKKTRSQSSTGWFFRGKQADARLQRALDDLEVGRPWGWVCLCAVDFSPCWNLLSWQHMQHTCSQVLNNYCSMTYIPTWMVNFYGQCR